jgi:hypothetical protein
MVVAVVDAIAAHHFLSDWIPLDDMYQHYQTANAPNFQLFTPLLVFGD